MKAKYFFFYCTIILFNVRIEAGELSPIESSALRPPLKDAAPLDIFLPHGIKPQLEVMTDYSGYRCDVPAGQGEPPLATMTIYIGQLPTSLSSLVGDNKFFQESAQ